MRSELLAALDEARGAWGAVQAAEPGRVGPLAVSGVLADQLVRELAADAQAGAVRVTESPLGASACVRVIAGDPTDDDRAVVRAADAVGTPVVLVQLWPQADWTRPFVLSPHVVECRAGEGFPMREIASRLSEAVERPLGLAAAVPALRDAATAGEIRRSVSRAALLALGGKTRATIGLEQLRLASRLRQLDGAGSAPVSSSILAATAVSVVAAGFALRAAARAAGRVLPRPLANATVAAVGTWALGEAVRRVDLPVGR